MKTLRNYSKVIALALSITIVLGMSIVSVAASMNTSNSTEISLGLVTGNPGDIKTIPISISNNKGISVFDFIITYDSNKLEPIDVLRGNALSGSFISNLNAGTGDNKYIRVVGASSNNYSIDDAILNVKFKIKDDAGLGEADVSLDVRELKHTNAQYKLEDLPYSVSNGKIVVGEIIVGEHEHDFTVEIERVGAICWTDGYILYKCCLCNETKKEMTFGHDYELIQRTVPTCWAGGGDFVKCKRCGYTNIINWKYAIGHKYGQPQPIPGINIWAIVYCEREGCGYSTYVPVGR